MTLPNPTKLPRYIIRRMFNQRSKATGTFKNYVNACVAGPGLKQKHLNSYRLSHQRNLMYFLEHKNEHLWNPAWICSPFLVKPPWGSAKLLFWKIGRVWANNRKKNRTYSHLSELVRQNNIIKTSIVTKKLIMLISCVVFGCRNRQKKSNEDKKNE